MCHANGVGNPITEKINGVFMLKASLILSTLILLASCGGGSDNSSTPTPSDSSSFQGGANCPLNVVNDATKLKAICQSQFMSDDNILNCIKTAEKFTNDYPQINCLALSLANLQTVDIDSNFIMRTQGSYTRENYLEYQNKKPCGIFVVNNFKDILGTFVNSKQTQEDELAMGKSLIEFEKSNPGIDCIANNTNGGTTEINSQFINKLIVPQQSN